MGSAADVLTFFWGWLRRPAKVGSVIPSSKGLARLITREISAATGPVIELGPGTGVFTAELLARGVAPADIALYEINPLFADLIARRFPHLRLERVNAGLLATIDVFPGRKAGAVVSGLPFLSLPDPLVERIIAGVFRQLGEGGSLYQFTYGLACPVKPEILSHHGLKAERMGFALLNFPPASVYRISRKSPALALAAPVEKTAG